ncbi:flagellar hook capping FlgD N-terminal domain-containing protein [Defluviimonas sp. D31]|uniref:flagellar hook capping FlgD N-terminal domain-containing protein n=1 Tax=Defluviimonas sp. D31 TaxID=3083253 RepID=UPI00296F436C|nr:flagellar hook capping FlgD N-terminal domain-containing protein [Defluviimonas sp. D31]MDW4549254.1 flagellar hook capping FlgD N-terminal domain-containing protein [Defluviimonas sp. D31]
MDAVTQTGSQATAATARAKNQHGTLINSDFQTFLVMLTTQMQNQDPLNPIDSTDYAAQLATFSGVEQQVKTNTLLESLSAQLGLSGMAQMASWVGMEARSSAPVLFDGTPLTLYPAPEAGADEIKLVAYDAQGREVMRSPAPVSGEPLVWAGTDSRGGPLPSGLYSFRLESYAAGEPMGVSDVESFARIAEVQNGPDGPVVVLDGGAQVAPSDIKSMRGAGSR